ncbi:hypothetical protein [Nocardioides sp.]|uniref:hypothetical protein n=1 Tax=Nocardioides sp. TaxID=35761 RepID=UPI002C3B0328|nr:hypothetical protein [Nocardioides sp.]HXH80427.1 hypothetical protein [Nocardioides sp.]
MLALLTAATFLPFGHEPAAASCASPYLTNVDDLVTRPGATVEIKGAGFANGCQDLGSCTTTLGCSECDYGAEPTPRSGITLTLRQQGRSWPLGTAEAGENATVTWTVDIPSEVKAGWATLVPEHGQRAKVRVR